MANYTTTETLTDTQIETLADEAATNSDDEMEAICAAALAGDDDARSEVASVIACVESNLAE